MIISDCKCAFLTLAIIMMVISSPWQSSGSGWWHFGGPSWTIAWRSQAPQWSVWQLPGNLLQNPSLVCDKGSEKKILVELCQYIWPDWLKFRMYFVTCFYFMSSCCSWASFNAAYKLNLKSCFVLPFTHATKPGHLICNPENWGFVYYGGRDFGSHASNHKLIDWKWLTILLMW